MKNAIVFGLLAACLLTGPSLAQVPAAPATQPATQPAAPAIPPGEFASLIGKPGYVLLDVRTPEEYTQGHLAGATLLDFHSAEFQQKLTELPKDKTYLVYCRSGRRSKSACEQMRQLGFSGLYDLQGGIQAWQKAGHPVQAP